MLFIYFFYFILKIFEVHTGNYEDYTVEVWNATTYCRDITISNCPSYKCSDFDNIINSCGCYNNNLRCNDSCTDKLEQYCFNCYEWVNVTKQRCKDKWTGGNCDIPICSGCTSVQYCVSPDRCECIKDVNNDNKCATTYCVSSAKDCFPGTCINGKCDCQPEFNFQNSDNCQYTSLRPKITGCKFQILYNENKYREINCVSKRLNKKSEQIYWFNAESIKSISGYWKMEFNIPPFQHALDKNLPNYIRDPFIQINESYYTITTNELITKKSCPINGDCNNIIQEWESVGLPKLYNNLKFTITVKAVLYGEKIFVNNGNYVKKYFEQNNLENEDDGEIIIEIDTKSPTHCILTRACDYYPIMLRESIVNEDIIKPNLTEWMDNSGISNILIEIFPMRSNYDMLEQLNDPELSINLTGIQITNIKFQLKKFGIYSVKQTVSDLAGNIAKSRKIILYTNKAINVNKSAPIYLDDINNISFDENLQISFIYRSRSNQMRFNVFWQNRYMDANTAEWKLPVKLDNSLAVEDSYDEKFGRRSIYKLKDYANLLAIAYTYNITQTNIEVQDPSLNEFYLKKADSMDFPIQFNLSDNSLITVWLKLYDIFGTNYEIERFQTIVEVDANSMSVNGMEFKVQTLSQYQSSFYLNIFNEISGIKQVKYQIRSENNITISETIFTPTILHKSSKKRKAQNGICNPLLDTDCFCAKFFNQCYFKKQEIVIDNCIFDKYVDNNLKINFEVKSYSNIVIHDTFILPSMTRESVPCRPQWLTKGAIAGIVIASIIAFLLLILFLVFCILHCCCRQNKYANDLRRIFTQMKYKQHSTEQMEVHNSENPLYMSYDEYTKAVHPEKKSLVEGNILRATKKRSNYLIPESSLSIGETIANGKFAVIRKGIYTHNNKPINVAIKSINDSAPKHDEDLMRKKIVFLMDLERRDVNLVEFLGATEKEISTAPCMVLELCDMTLKEWLKAQKTVNHDTLVNMLRFATHIAKALDTLHKGNVIHRKVALRNVLLKKEAHGYQAKLIGYGPSRDIDPENPDRNSLVALKWLAPETLETLDEPETIYNTMTDVWSYGITLWELLSLGAPPFAQQPSSKKKKVPTATLR